MANRSEDEFKRDDLSYLKETNNTSNHGNALEKNFMTCEVCEKERSCTKLYYSFKEFGISKPSFLNRGCEKLNNSMKHNFSSGKMKPLIKKSKLKLIGTKFYEETNGKKPQDSLSQTISKGDSLKSCKIHLKRKSASDKELLDNNNKRERFPSKVKVFEKELKSQLMEDFRSLSLKGNRKNDNKVISCKQINFLSFGKQHRGNNNLKSSLSHKRGRRKLSDYELPDMNSLSISEASTYDTTLSCAEQARSYEDISTVELAAYLDNHLHFPKKMSDMAERMYT